MCARVCLWVCAGVWIHVRVHVQGCVHVSACFFTRVCVHRGAPALPQKSFLGEAELTRDCWSTGPGSTALQHCALHSSLQDGTEHCCVGVLGCRDEALHRTHVHTHSRPKRAFKHCSAQLPIRQEVPKGPSASTARIGCKGRDWLAQGLAGIPMEAAVSSA